MKRVFVAAMLCGALIAGRSEAAETPERLEYARAVGVVYGVLSMYRAALPTCSIDDFDTERAEAEMIQFMTTNSRLHDEAQRESMVAFNIAVRGGPRGSECKDIRAKVKKYGLSN